MPLPPVAPIVIAENGDINLYPTVDAAARELEAVDVLDGIYEIFDSLGHRLSVGVEGEMVRIWSDPSSPLEANDLEARLRQFVDRLGPERVGVSDVEKASLKELILSLGRFFRAI